MAATIGTDLKGKNFSARVNDAFGNEVFDRFGRLAWTSAAQAPTVTF